MGAQSIITARTARRGTIGTVVVELLEITTTFAWPVAASDERQVRALNLALYKLTQLATNMHKSRRALNDLRSIRRLLFTERELDEISEPIEIAKRATTSI